MAGLPSLLLLLCVATLCLANLDDNCMVRRLEQSGIKRGKAVAYGKNLVQAGFSEKFLSTTPAPITAFFIKGTEGEVEALQKCIVGVLKACKDSSPCHNGGKCLLSRSRRDYVCKCPKHFTGPYCQTPRPAPVGEFRALEKTVRGLAKTQTYQRKNLASQRKNLASQRKNLASQRKNLASQRKALASQRKLLAAQGKRLSATRAELRRVRKEGKVPVCPSSSLLGYKYTSRHYINEGRDSGTVMSLGFRKKLPNTLLRMSFSSAVGISSRHKAARWFFKIDNRECSSPSKLDTGLYNGVANEWIITPSVLKGICKGTSSGNIGMGYHTITVHVGKEPINRHGNALSGWYTTSFLEVQEICPPF